MRKPYAVVSTRHDRIWFSHLKCNFTNPFPILSLEQIDYWSLHRFPPPAAEHTVRRPALNQNMVLEASDML
jgi:hypothetical protein